ncbi:MAG: imidazole glycerol phosphate synthase subunit HisH [Oleiphilaceae bacterium]|nr:imidazole glycerol phosphate synthase subunit HisH [Oleiphilaceae bacterium]
MNSIAIIDYGMGNLHSVSKAFEHVAPDARVLVTSDPALIREADRVVLPGVGAIRDCMAEIRRLNVNKLVREVALDRPLLGICVGMQAMMRHSEENGGVDGIGIFEGEVRFFGEPLLEADGERLKVPHMGWNQVAQQAHPLWQGIDDMSRFYFVHSYYVAAENTACIGRTHYGKEIAAAVARDNIFAVQFHPEKSQHSGLQLLKNFATWSGQAD